MAFRKINTLTGWAVGMLACIVYLSTMEASGSFWDCGEFISCATKLQIPHPPGAPLFILLGRLFVLFSPSNPARAVNTLSALSSGLAILFLFWTITHFARKWIGKKMSDLNRNEIFTIMSAGVVGALAYTFSDSFWFSAVEGEVYGLSGFLTALVIWTVLQWEDRADEPGSDKWLVLVFFLIGLSIGVHLLSLLAIPSVVMVYYFRRFKATWPGAVLAFIVACALTGFVQIAVIQKTVFWATDLDVYFVNSLHLPFFTGFAAFFALLFLLLCAGILAGGRWKLRMLQLSCWSLLFLLIGYSSYITPLERSNADPAIDVYNVDNPVSLSGYLGRDQYGDFPLIRGQVFTARPRSYETVGNLYMKGNGHYDIAGKIEKPVYAPQDQMWLSRVWDNSNEQNHADFYAEWLGIRKDPQSGVYERPPNQLDNFNWFLTYQFNWMYWRYFFWNFSGRQNDLAGFGNPRDGNFITGFPFIDRLWLGDQTKMPDSARTKNKGFNRLFLLPFLLGLLGCFAQWVRRPKDWVINAVLFFFTGIAIVLYLNQPGNQPRERDYAYTGSFYAFSIWIGLGVCLVTALLNRIRFIRGRVAAWLALALCLAVPALMASQEWNDHDRSRKTLALSMARNYLESCAPGAILFTFGDNDTYPLWFAQEAMGVRPDVRVVNTSLLSFDWYINQLRYKINQSDPFDPIWTAAQVAGDRRDVIYNRTWVGGRNERPDSGYLDLATMMRQSGSDDPAYTFQTDDGSTYNTFSSHLVSVPVDTSLVRANGTVDPGDRVVKRLEFRIPRNAILKGDATVLSIIATNRWKRPIYFTSVYDDLGFGRYLRQDGLAYRLVPVENDPVHTSWMTDKLLNVFTFGGAEKPGVYFDEENRTHLITIREAYINLAVALIKSGKTREAGKVLEKCDQGMDPGNMPYGMCSRYGNFHNRTSERFASLAYQAGDTGLARKIDASVRKDCVQQLRYYEALPDWRKTPGNSLEYETRTARDILEELDKLKMKYDARP